MIDDTSETFNVNVNKDVKMFVPSSTLIQCPKIDLGDTGGQSLIFGEAFMSLFNSHTHPCPMSHSFATSEQFTPSLLSKISKTT